MSAFYETETLYDSLVDDGTIIEDYESDDYKCVICGDFNLINDFVCENCKKQIDAKDAERKGYSLGKKITQNKKNKKFNDIVVITVR